MSDDMLKRLLKRREEANTKREELRRKRLAIAELAQEENREDLSTEEQAEYDKLTDEIRVLDEGDDDLGVVGIAAMDERIRELSEEMERDRTVTAGAEAVRRAQARIESVSEARVYEARNGNSYFRDLVLAKEIGDDQAQERLRRHAQDVATDPEYRQLSRTDGAGGHFVPPLHLVQQFVELARAGRATANVVSNMDLPPGTDSINIPKIATGSETAIQTADNTAIANEDMTDTSVTAPVRTIAGEQDVAVQLLEQSPVNFDEVIFRDLIADYATRLDRQVINGSALSGQVRGILATSDIVGLTWTEASPTVDKLYGVLADAVQRVNSERFMPPEVIVMHPRRWGWFLAALDDVKRPLVLPQTHNPQNAVGVLANVGAEQVVGNLHGLPVVTDPNIPVDLGDGNNEDVILVLRASDLWLFESSIRSRVVTSASGTDTATSLGARTLTSTLQVYGYLAFTAGRQPKSVATVTGTGLATPDFGSDPEGS